MMCVFIHRLTHSVPAIRVLICYVNINIFMHSVSGKLQGILVLNKIEYPIASEELRPPDPLLQRFNTEGSSSLSNPQSAPEYTKNLLTPVL